MQGQITQIRIIIKLLLCLVFWSFATSSQANENSILIIKSNENQFFNQTIQELINTTHRQVKFNIITADSFESDPEAYNPKIIVTLGSKAAALTIGKKSQIPVIHSYITQFQHSEHTGYSNHFSVFLDQPIKRYFNFIKQLLPANKIGILKSKNKKISTKTIKEIEMSTGLNLEQKIISSSENPINAVRKILQKNDVLMSLPEPEIYNKQTLKGILLTSYRLNKPLISYSPAHVKSGALAAIYTAPEHIGVQVAGVVNRILDNKKNTLKHNYFADNFNISINLQVAHSLGIDLPPETEILKQLKPGENP